MACIAYAALDSETRTGRLAEGHGVLGRLILASTTPVIVHLDECETESWEDGRRGTVRWKTLLSGDRTNTESLTLGVAELPPGETEALGRHRHDPPEVYYVLEGRGEVAIEERGKPPAAGPLALRPGCAVFIPGGAWHSVRNTGDRALRVLYAFATDTFGEISYQFDDGPVTPTPHHEELS